MLSLRSTKVLPLALALAAAVGLSATPAHANGPSRWIAAMPFGAGQFQNGDVGLGIFFAGSEAALGVTSIVTGVLTMHLASASETKVTPDGRKYYLDRAEANDRIRTLTTMNRIAFASLAAFAVAGVVEAQINFGPRRAVPAEPAAPSITVSAAPVPGGGLIGFRAEF